MLMIASIYANFETASLLVEYGADVNTQGNDGQSASLLACQSGYTKIVELLLEQGADVNIQSRFSGRSALMIASRNRNIKLVELSLNHGADVSLKDSNGFSALMFADKRQ